MSFGWPWSIHLECRCGSSLAIPLTSLSCPSGDYSPGFIISRDNIGPLRINSKCLGINSGVLSYLRYYICSVSNLMLLFKIESRKYQLQSYYMYFNCLLGSWGLHNPEITIFLRLPLLSTVNS